MQWGETVLAHHFCPSAGVEIWRILAYFFPPIHHTEGTWQHITPYSTTAKLCNHVWTDFSEFHPDCLKSASSKRKKNEYIHTKLVQACQNVINLSVNCKILPAVTWMYVACALNVVLILQSICHPLRVYERWETRYLAEHSEPLCVVPAAERRLKWIFSRGRRLRAHTNTQAAPGPQEAHWNTCVASRLDPQILKHFL